MGQISGWIEREREERDVISDKRRGWGEVINGKDEEEDVSRAK